jgi:hypothetical protein
VNLEQLDRVSFIHCQLYFQSILIQSGWFISLVNYFPEFNLRENHIQHKFENVNAFAQERKLCWGLTFRMGQLSATILETVFHHYFNSGASQWRLWDASTTRSGWFKQGWWTQPIPWSDIWLVEAVACNPYSISKYPKESDELDNCKLIIHYEIMEWWDDQMCGVFLFISRII